MNTKIKLGLLLLFVLVVTTTTVTIIHSQKKENTDSFKQQTIYQDDVPIANYNEPLPTDLKEKAKRQKRSIRRNIKLGLHTGVSNPRGFMITEERESAYGGFSSHARKEPAIPAAKSDVIVTAEITKAKAFLSEDKTAIYSEFTVNVSSILKNSTSEAIYIGDSITISRNGGAVRFPSGKVIRDLFDGKPMPHVGGKYILFLKYEAGGNDYPLITGYEIRDNKVIPLDGLDVSGKVISELASHQSYKGSSEAEFLNLIQFAISSKQDLFQQEVQ